MHIEIWTQYRENYGFSEGTQHWKCKGGYEYTIDVDVDALLSADDMAAYLQSMVEAFAAETFYDDDCSSETIIDWELVDTDTQAVA